MDLGLAVNCQKIIEENRSINTDLFLFLLLPPDISINTLPDCKLASSLTNLGQVGTREASGHLCHIRQVHILCHRTFPEVGLEYGHPGAVIRERNVDQLVKTAGSEETQTLK